MYLCFNSYRNHRGSTKLFAALSFGEKDLLLFVISDTAVQQSTPHTTVKKKVGSRTGSQKIRIFFGAKKKVRSRILGQKVRTESGADRPLTSLIITDHGRIDLGRFPGLISGKLQHTIRMYLSHNISLINTHSVPT